MMSLRKKINNGVHEEDIQSFKLILKPVINDLERLKLNPSNEEIDLIIHVLETHTKSL